MHLIHAGTPQSGLNTGELYHSYEDGTVLTMFLAGRKPATLRKYQKDLELFMQWLGARSLAGVRLEDLQLWAGSLSGAPKTVRERIATVRSFFVFAKKVGYIRYNPAELVELPGVKDTLHERILTEAERKAIRAAASCDRDEVLIDFLLQSGLRVSELCSLQWKDVREREDGALVLNIWRQKSSKLTTQKYRDGSRVATALKALRVGKSDKDYIFTSNGVPATIKSRAGQNAGGKLDSSAVFRIVRATAKRAGIDKPVSPHWLRHSCATRLAGREKNYSKIAAWLGHSNIATTMRYVHLEGDLDLSEHLED